MDALLRPPITFGHRGARAHAPENTIDAFKLALRLGARGIESDVWLTADGVVVLDHDGVVKVGRRRRAIRDMARAELPLHLPSLEDLFAACGHDYHLSLDVKDPAAAAPVVDVARVAGMDLSRLWLCHSDWEVVASWRAFADDVRLVDSTRIKAMKQGPERRAAQLANAGVDCVNLHHTDWSLGMTTLFHRFERFAFAWDAQYEHVMENLVRVGVDGIYSDHVDRLVDVVGA